MALERLQTLKNKSFSTCNCVLTKKKYRTVHEKSSKKGKGNSYKWKP